MDDHDAEKLRFTLQTKGWIDYLEPLLEEEKERYVRLLALTNEERPTPKASDDYLRGYLRAILFMMSRPQQTLDEHDAEKLAEPQKEPKSVGDPYHDPLSS